MQTVALQSSVTLRLKPSQRGPHHKLPTIASAFSSDGFGELQNCPEWVPRSMDHLNLTGTVCAKTCQPDLLIFLMSFSFSLVIRVVPHSTLLHSVRTCFSKTF